MQPINYHRIREMRWLFLYYKLENFTRSTLAYNCNVLVIEMEKIIVIHLYCQLIFFRSVADAGIHTRKNRYNRFLTFFYIHMMKKYAIRFASMHSLYQWQKKDWCVNRFLLFLLHLISLINVRILRRIFIYLSACLSVCLSVRYAFIPVIAVVTKLYTMLFWL